MANLFNQINYVVCKVHFNKAGKKKKKKRKKKKKNTKFGFKATAQAQQLIS